MQPFCVVGSARGNGKPCASHVDAVEDVRMAGAHTEVTVEEQLADGIPNWKQREL